MRDKKLEKILYERLDIAMAFEREKKVVIPETTCIIRDIMKLKGINVNDKIKNKKDEGLSGW